MQVSTVTLNTLWIPHTVLDRSAGWLKIPEEIPVQGGVCLGKQLIKASVALAIHATLFNTGRMRLLYAPLSYLATTRKTEDEKVWMCPNVDILIVTK